jgi:hypothetical protein
VRELESEREQEIKRVSESKRERESEVRERESEEKVREINTYNHQWDGEMEHHVQNKLVFDFLLQIHSHLIYNELASTYTYK